MAGFFENALMGNSLGQRAFEQDLWLQQRAIEEMKKMSIPGMGLQQAQKAAAPAAPKKPEINPVLLLTGDDE